MAAIDSGVNVIPHGREPTSDIISATLNVRKPVGDVVSAILNRATSIPP